MGENKKIRCRIEVNLETGDYEIFLENITNPGQPMDYHHIRKTMTKVLTDWGVTLEEGIDSTDEVIKSIH